MITRNDASLYTDCYFTKTREAATHNPKVLYQVFQRKEAVLAGMGLVLPLFDGLNVEIKIRQDGSVIHPWEPVMTLRGRLSDLVELETIYLGILDECTRVATKIRAAVDEANGKDVLFFAARFAIPEVQRYHGYAAYIGGAAGCSTFQQTYGYRIAHNTYSNPARNKHPNFEPVGTMPHAMIAAFGGSTVKAAVAFAEARPNEKIWVLVDFDNSCASTALDVVQAFRERGIERRLAGVRLDTSDKLVDNGLLGYSHAQMGVCPELVIHVRKALDAVGAAGLKIAVSGGFTPEKIKLFESLKVPADVYAIGESFLKSDNAFTSDIVSIETERGWELCHKLGRPPLPTDKLVPYRQPYTVEATINS